MAPGAPGSSPAAFAFVIGANNAVQLRASGGAQRTYSVKIITASATCNVATGPSDVAVPTATDPLLAASDGWQDMTLASGSTHIRLFGGATGGTLSVWDWGC
jgi:hypothetical protein